MGELTKLPNIGKVVESILEQVGIYNKEALSEVGSLEAWLRIQKIDDSACYNLLCGLEGAIQGIPKKELSEQDKNYLKQFYNEHKGG